MADIESLDQRRWRQNNDPNKHKPAEALRAILRDIESGELDVNHVIVVYSRRKSEEDPNGGTGYYQAGDVEGIYGAKGLLSHALHLMNNA